jgi:pimeloyl-ACP methyl ester carboxylesterase
MTTGRLDVDGAHLAHRVDGSGADVLLIHAGVADMRMWDAVVEELAGRLRTIRFDLRGFGETTAEPRLFSPSADIVALLEELGAPSATVVGASFGGRVALEFASEHPDRVRGLVLLDAGLPDHDWGERVQRFGADEEAALDAGRIDEAVELNVDMWAPGSPPHVRELVRDMQARAFALQADPALDIADLDPPLPERLGAIAVPAVVAYGEEDVPDYAAVAQRLVHELPDARLVAIPGAAHLPALDQPAAVARLILDAAG